MVSTIKKTITGILLVAVMAVDAFAFAGTGVDAASPCAKVTSVKTTSTYVQVTVKASSKCDVDMTVVNVNGKYLRKKGGPYTVSAGKTRTFKLVGLKKGTKYRVYGFETHKNSKGGKVCNSILSKTFTAK